MKHFWRFVAAGALATLGMAQVQAQTLRVGTFHKASIVVAFYRSPMWAEVTKAKIAEQQAAKKANDTKKVQEMEQWGKGHQELAHQQLAGEAPLTNILEMMTPGFAEIAQKAQVGLIVPDVLYANAGVQTVDVTEQMLDWLKADETTRKIVLEVRSHPGPVHAH